MKMDTQVLEDARRLVSVTADVEVLLLFLRDRGLDKIDSIRVVRELLGKTTGEAKGIVDGSVTWSDRYHSDKAIHEAARAAIKQLSGEKGPDLPKSTFREK